MMFRRCSSLALPVLLAGAVALAGCSNDKPRTTAPTHGSTTTTSTSTHATTGATTSGTPKARTGTVTSSGGKPLPTSTGIAACDDYLSSYMACHAVANVYTPDVLQKRYDDIRTSLLQDSVDPATRPQLGARCTAMAKQLRETLHGRSCAPTSPSPAVTTTH